MIWFLWSDGKKTKKNSQIRRKNVDSADSFGSGSVGEVFCASFLVCEDSFRKDWPLPVCVCVHVILDMWLQETPILIVCINMWKWLPESGLSCYYMWQFVILYFSLF